MGLSGRHGSLRKLRGADGVTRLYGTLRGAYTVCYGTLTTLRDAEHAMELSQRYGTLRMLRDA